jgi:hypothetical protein
VIYGDLSVIFWPILTFICLRQSYISYDLVHRTFTAQVRDVSTCVGARVVEGVGNHYVSTCVGARVVKGVGNHYVSTCGSAGCGGGLGTNEQKQNLSAKAHVIIVSW